MTHRTAALGVALALAATTLAQVASTAPTDAARAGQVTPSRGDQALTRLAAESTGPVTVTRGDDGLARVVGVSGGRNPVVTRATPAPDAARAHLARYGALVGVADPGTQLVGGTVTRSVTGDDVVRFTERRQGLPVIGGAVAVDLRPDRQLGSVTASVSRASVPDATYSSTAASQEALAVAAKRLGGGAGVGLTADPPVRRLYDPAVLGVRRTSDPTTHARGVWSVEVHAGPAFHRLLLIDDRTGGVVQDLDLVEQVNRVVCDDDNAPDTTDVPCKTNFARTEGDPPSPVKDVNDAFDLAGVVSTFYRQIGGINLTKLLGVDEGTHLSLSSTVRYCDFALPPAFCPYQNAFWNGAAHVLRRGLRLGRRRRRPRDDPWRDLAQLRPLLLGSVRGDQRVAGRHHGRDRGPPAPEPGRLPAQLGARRGPADRRGPEHEGPRKVRAARHHDQQALRAR